MSLHRRIARLEETYVWHLAQPRAPELADLRPWEVWRPEDRDAWLQVSAEEKDRLWQVFERCCIPPYQPPACLVRLWQGRWIVTTFNTPFGRAAYCLGHTLAEMTEGAFVAWVETVCTPQEADALWRQAEHGWHAEALEAGDTALLHGLIARLPRTRPRT